MPLPPCLSYVASALPITPSLSLEQCDETTEQTQSSDTAMEAVAQYQWKMKKGLEYVQEVEE